MCEGNECTRQYRESWIRLPGGQYLYKMEVWSQAGYFAGGWVTVVEDVVSLAEVPYDQSRRELVKWQR